MQTAVFVATQMGGLLGVDSLLQRTLSTASFTKQIVVSDFQPRAKPGFQP